MRELKKALRATAGVKLAESEISDRSIRVNAGAHSPDGAYTMLTVEIGSVFIQVESAHVGERDLVILVRPQSNELKAPSMIVEAAFLCRKQNRPAAVAVFEKHRVVFMLRTRPREKF